MVGEIVVCEPTQPEEEMVLTEPTEDTSEPEGEIISTESPQNSSQDQPVSLSAPDQELPLNGRYNLRRNVKPPERFVKQVLVRDEHTS